MSDVDDLVEDLGEGQRRAIARLLTLIEDGSPETLREIVSRIYPRSGGAHILGITGSPGVGKSTLTNALVEELRARDRTVGIVAIDPSSPFSGGALLGDRVRMQSHHADEGVFIRSMAARGHLGGIAFATPQAVLVLDAAGFDTVVVETVGVGQSEVEVASTADTTVVTVAPGMGDSVQAAKAGILEVADIFVVNKADHAGAGKTESELRSMLDMGQELTGDHGWRPPILRTVSVRSEGVGELLDAIDEHHDHLETTGRLEDRRRHRARYTVREIAMAQMRERFVTLGGDAGEGMLDTLAVKVANRDLDPYSAADQLLSAAGA